MSLLATTMLKVLDDSSNVVWPPGFCDYTIRNNALSSITNYGKDLVQIKSDTLKPDASPARV